MLQCQVLVFAILFTSFSESKRSIHEQKLPNKYVDSICQEKNPRAAKYQISSKMDLTILSKNLRKFSQESPLDYYFLQEITGKFVSSNKRHDITNPNNAPIILGKSLKIAINFASSFWSPPKKTGWHWMIPAKTNNNRNPAVKWQRIEKIDNSSVMPWNNYHRFASNLISSPKKWVIYSFKLVGLLRFTSHLSKTCRGDFHFDPWAKGADLCFFVFEGCTESIPIDRID